MAKNPNGSPLEDAAEWARKCRVEAVRAIHPTTKEFLLGLAAHYDAISGGWPAVVANLKSLLETGDVLPQAPWEMHAGLRDAQMARND